VYLPRDPAATVTDNAHHMTVLAVIAALATATCVGYYFGRRSGSAPSTWKQRTSRIAVGRLAISLALLLTARRIRRSFRTDRPLRAAVHFWGPRLVAPLGLLRGSALRSSW
jgi:hypothetical protein